MGLQREDPTLCQELLRVLYVCFCLILSATYL